MQGQGEATLSIALLGPPIVTVEGRPLAVDTRKAVALLALLAVDGRQSRELLAARLWPDSEDARARGALRRTLSVLNAGTGGVGIETARDGIELATEGVATDIGSWADAAAATGGHDHPRTGTCAACIPTLRAGVALHRGDFLAGFALRDATGFSDWQTAHVERYRRELCGALDRLTRAEVEEGELDAATVHAQRWLTVDPLNEQVHGRLMLLHAWQGQRGEAIRRYRECVALLDRELGVRPLETTTRLYRSILDGQVDRPGAPLRTKPPAPRPPDARPVDRFDDPPFVGRDEPLAGVVGHLGDVAGAVVAVVGEAGIGRTRFAEELEAQLHREGGVVATSRCHAGESSLAFGAAIDLLRSAASLPGAAARLAELPGHVVAEAARLLPELAAGRTGLPAPLPLDAPGARAGFLDALLQVLESSLGPSDRRTLLVEDVHLVDEPTADLLAYLVHRGAARRIDLVLTWRTAELPEGHPLALLPRDADVRARWRTIELARLDSAATAACCAGVLGDRPDLAAVTQRLERESEGLPLALTEYLRWLVAGEPAPNPAPNEEWPIPTGVRDLVRGRLDELGEVAGQIVAAAAVLGHGFDATALAATAGRTEAETVDALDELLLRGFVASSPTVLGTYAFAHGKARAVAYEDTSPVRRRLLHARAAEALAARTTVPRELSAVIAEHARLGGLHELAAAWEVRAGDHARFVFANSEAREHYEQALALGHPEPASLHARVARLLVLDGDYRSALDRYELAAALANDVLFASVEHELGGLHLRRRQWTAARVHLETGLASAGDDPTLAARLTADLGVVALNEGDLEGAERLAAEALARAEESGDRQALAQARNLAGLLARRRGDVATAHRHLENAAALASTLEDPSAYIAALNNLAMTAADAGEHDRARTLLMQALERCGRQGDRHRQAAILNNLADLAHRAGGQDEAMALLKQAVALFAEIGAPEVHEPEIWKLVSW